MGGGLPIRELTGRLGLGPRLALSYGAVAGLFMVVVLLLFPRLVGLSGSPVPTPGESPLPPHERLEARLALLAGEASEAWRERGEAGLVEAVRGARLPKDTGLSVFTDEGGRQALQTLSGLEVDPPPEQVWKGRSLSLVISGLGLVSYQAVRAEGRTVAVLALSRPFPAEGRYGAEQDTMQGLMIAVALGLGVCLAAGLAFSTVLTRPLRHLAEAVRSFGPDRLRPRAPVEGPREIADLAASFNEMAARLEEALETTRREKERAEGLEASRREFLEDVSHNLGTPLAAVQGWVEMLMEEGLIRDPAEREQLLDRARREILIVSRMVRQLLDLSRWESAPPSLRMEDFPLVEPLMEVAENLEEAAEGAGTTLTFEGLDPTHRVRADRSRARELFQIFLENCIHHGGEGCSVLVRLWPEGGRLHVEIEDDGPGIPPERLPHLRERHHGSGGRGSGLGMAIAHRLVESHGGDLQVQNREEGGTRVRFSLPLAPGPVRTSGTGLKDRPEVRDLVERRLQQEASRRRAPGES